MPLHLQQLFNKVVRHLTTQNTKAIDGENCRYRAADGRQCAVGCLIDAAHYDNSFEGNCPDWTENPSSLNTGVSLGIFNAVVASQQITFPENSEYNTRDKILLNQLLRQLQNVHDTCDVEKWSFHLKRVAAEFDLDYAN